MRRRPACSICTYLHTGTEGTPLQNDDFVVRMYDHFSEKRFQRNVVSLSSSPMIKLRGVA